MIFKKKLLAAIICAVSVAALSACGHGGSLRNC